MEVKSRRGDGALQCRIQIGPHAIVSDAPRTSGGEETGPEPHDLLAAALAACTSLTVTIYARRKSMDLQDIEVSIQHGQRGDTYELVRNIHYIGNLSAEERQRLTDIANKCPVHKTLSGQIQIVTEAH
ncbi:OsmC family protein [Undibacterium arcticum]|uniref:OsmC family protein n=1 Tax=Undibacterium arcticum TaxID=1762892 RepID=A0ABV7EUI5_9BURK